MIVEYHVVRKIWVAECHCNSEEPFRRIESNNAPRETQCPKCKTWLSFHEETASSPEYKGNRQLLRE